MIPGLKEVLEDATGRLVAAQYSDRDFQGLPADHPSRFMKGQISKLSDQAESGTGGTGTLMLGSRHRTGTTLVSLKALLRARRLGAGTLQLTRHYLSTVRSEGFWVTVDRQVDVPGRTEIRTVANYRHTIPIAWLSLYLAPDDSYPLSVFNSLLASACDSSGWVRAYEYQDDEIGRIVATAYFVGFCDGLLEWQQGRHGSILKERICSADEIREYRNESLDWLLSQRSGGLIHVVGDDPFSFIATLATVMGGAWAETRPNELDETLAACFPLIESDRLPSDAPREQGGLSGYRRGLAIAYLLLLMAEQLSTPSAPSRVDQCKQYWELVIREYQPDQYLREPDLCFLVEGLSWLANLSPISLTFADTFAPISHNHLVRWLANHISIRLASFRDRWSEETIHFILEDFFRHEVIASNPALVIEVVHEKPTLGGIIDLYVRITHPFTYEFLVEVKVVDSTSSVISAIKQASQYAIRHSPPLNDALCLLVQREEGAPGESFRSEPYGIEVVDGVSVHLAFAAPHPPPAGKSGSLPSSRRL